MDATRIGLPVVPLDGRFPAQLSDVIGFIEGRINERLLESHLWGLNAIDWRKWNIGETPYAPLGDSVLPPAYALLKLTHATLLPNGGHVSSTSPALPYDPGIIAAAAAGRCAESTRRAAQRLYASGWTPLVLTVAGSAEHVRRCAASSLFPLRASDLRTLSGSILRGNPEKTSNNPKSAHAEQ
jgi:CRISPR-associated protein Csx17